MKEIDQEELSKAITQNIKKNKQSLRRVWKSYGSGGRNVFIF